MDKMYRALVAFLLLCAVNATEAGAQVASEGDTTRAAGAAYSPQQQYQQYQRPTTTPVTRRPGVTIRSINDNRRRIYIIRPVVVAPGQTVQAPATTGPAVEGSGIDANDLLSMEDRLRRYIDARVARTPTVIQSPGQTTTVIPPESVQRGPGDVVRTTPTPLDTVETTGDTERPRTQITPPTPTPQAVTPLPATDVRFIERALLETGLFRTSNIIFEFDRDQLLTYSFATLDAIGDILRRHPDVKIMIVGHTDGVGSEDYNQGLSERRANTVLAYLSDNFGLRGDRLTAIGKGESEPLAPNTNSTGRAINRRVEFIVVD